MKKLLMVVITVIVSLMLTVTTLAAEAKVIDGCKAVNVRKSPSTDSLAVERLRENTEVKILKKGDKWTKVQYKDIIGYIRNDFLTFKDTPTTKKIDVEDLEYLGKFEITAYTFSGCGKKPSDKYYGITADGTDLKGKKFFDDAWCIAVDPKIIPYGTRVYIDFGDDPDRCQYTGIYTAHDCGGAGMKGKRIDIFMGEKRDEEAERFGRQRKIRVYIIPD